MSDKEIALRDQIKAALRDEDHRLAARLYADLMDECDIISKLPESLRGVSFDLQQAWKKYDKEES